jgi:hypothetical protein
MPNVIPAPIPPATATTPGIVSTATQTLGAGDKTIGGKLTVGKPPVLNEPALIMPGVVSSSSYGSAGAIVWGAGGLDGITCSIENLSIGTYNKPITIGATFSSVNIYGVNYGTVSTDVVVKVGAATADGSVHASAKLFSVRTGIGGTEVEKAYILKDGTIVSGSSQMQPSGIGFFAAQVYSNSYRPASGGIGIVLNSSHSSMISGDVAAYIGTPAADANVNASAKLLSVCSGIGGTLVEKAFFTGAGGLVVSGTPGASATGLTSGMSAALGSYNVNIGSTALWLGTSAPDTTNYTLATSSSGGLGTPVGTTLRAVSGPLRAIGTNGTITGDLCVTVGTETADGSVHANAHLLSVRTGVRATEVEKFWVNKLGPAMPLNGQFAMNGDGGGIFLTYRSGDGMAGFSNGAAAYLGIFPGTGAAACSGGFTANGGFVAAAGTTLAVGTTITDTSGTPGAATINAGKGRAALANAATSIVITNSLVDANSVVLIEWEDDPGQRHRVTVAAGSFTVTLSAAAAANVKFRFFVVK